MFYRLCSLGIDAMTDCFIVFASGAKQTPGRVGFRKAYTFSLKSWDISLALNMTYLICGIAAPAARKDALYPLSSALPTLRLRGGRSPFVAIATFPPFQRGEFTPKEEAKEHSGGIFR